MLFASVVVAAAAASSRSRHLIAGGTAPALDRFPFFTRVPQRSGYFCGGSLIAPDLVLTTPYCM